MNKEHFVHFLKAVLAEVEKDASMEGRIEYEWADKPGEYNVNAFVRTGNDLGQGGGMIINEKLSTMPSRGLDEEETK